MAISIRNLLNCLQDKEAIFMAKYTDDELDDGEEIDYSGMYDDEEDDSFADSELEIEEILESLIEDLTETQLEDLYRKLGDHILSMKSGNI
jgi:hypothetical protein